ncbi:golgin subfamily A member 6-like protein 22 [Sycon ciliatum]|uniref:golgin subfamily A member 6-like protein 22 n=1 Tax=Sycon ciliatum TaxID=27933 RepID=UPI0031F6341E
MEEFSVYVGNLRPSADPASIARLFSRSAKLTINIRQIRVHQSDDLSCAHAIISLYSERERVFAIRALHGLPRSKIDGDCLSAPHTKLQVENRQLHELRQRLNDRSKSKYKKLGVASLPTSPRKTERELAAKETERNLISQGWRPRLMKTFGGKTKNEEPPGERYYEQGTAVPQDNRIQVFKTGENNYLELMFGLDVGSFACAFLNSRQGGCLYIGVKEDGTVRGIHCDRLQQSQVMNDVKDAVVDFNPSVQRQMYGVDFVPVKVVDEHTGWLNKSTLRVVEVSVKGAGTDEDTWYEDNKGQVYIGEDGKTQPVRVSKIKAHLLEDIRKDTAVLEERKRVFEEEHTVLVQEQEELVVAQEEVSVKEVELNEREDLLNSQEKDLKETSERLDRDMTELKRMSDELEQTKLTAHEEVQDLESQQQSLVADIDKKKQELDDLIKSMEDKQTEITQQLADIKQKLTDIKEEREELARGRTEVAEQKAQLEEDQRLVEEEKERLKSKTCVIQ